MAKGQMRSTREKKKPKATDKTKKVAKYQGENVMTGGKSAHLEIKPKK